MQKIAITGGSGFVGSTLIQELLKKQADVRITSISRNEDNQSRLVMECKDKRLNIEMIDIRDAEAVRSVLHDKDILIHLAAEKRVSFSEENCHEATTVNVLGAMNLIDAFKGKTFILMSTNMAIEPCNCYGATKLISERLILERARKSPDGKRYMIVRCGNIIGSTGSVMDTWIDQIEEKNEISVTDPDMTIYSTTVKDVVELFIDVLEHGKNGSIYLDGKPQFLKEMSDKVVKVFGNGNTQISVTGLREGERKVAKMHYKDELNTVWNFA